MFGGLHTGLRITADDLRALRRLRRWSQSDLAERLGVACATVQAWERGRRTTPAMLTLALIGLDTVDPGDS